jgi:hypothetical protein
MKTSMQELKDKIQHEIEELNGELNEYKAGYKQCLINIQNDIDCQMLQMEKEQIKNAYYTGGDDIEDNRDREAEQYYNETFKSE